MDETQDKILVCVDCGKDFEFSARDQEFYKVHGYVDPRRCKPCRKIKKARFGDKEKPKDIPVTYK